MTADCGLCRKAEAMLRRLQQKIRFDVILVDIGADDDFFRKYWDRVPVVLVDGAEVAAAPVDEKRLAAALGA
jgi:thiol-disulfide isomerase/thioredoxin